MNTSSAIQHSTVLQITRSTVERSCAVMRSSSQERGSNTSQTGVQASGSGQGPGGVGQSFMAVLSAKLISNTSTTSSGGNSTTGSPKSGRKHSLEQQQLHGKNTRTGFLETLNAKLSQQQQQALHGQGTNSTSRSASVRRIMGNRVPIMDPMQVRDSLMDQIRRGTSLRKTSGPINDRSAPKIY